MTKKNETNQTSQTKDEKEEKEKDIFEIKFKKLLFFKNIINNLQILYDEINILRTKGFNIPIVINVSIKYPEIKYKLNGQEKDFSIIKDYLIRVKNDYEEQLITIYENEKYLRLLYGKLFRNIKQHQGGNYEILEIIRYILNKTNNKDKIEDGDLYNESLGEDYEEQYKDYTKKIFDQISKYLISLFKNNKSNFKIHYDNMKIKEENNCKGISIKKCEKISMEEYILYLFNSKLKKSPIAQNILICSNETYIEELQSFLYRAILCESNTLFVLAILQSFSNFQHNKMYSYIDKLLSIKLEKYKKQNEEKKIKDIDKSKSRDYMDSYIVFVYNELDNENAFKNEIKKYTRKNQKGEEEDKKRDVDKEKEKNLNISNISSISIIQDDDSVPKNIIVISSDICGLGKSFKIKKMIEKRKKQEINMEKENRKIYEKKNKKEKKKIKNC